MEARGSPPKAGTQLTLKAKDLMCHRPSLGFLSTPVHFQASFCSAKESLSLYNSVKLVEAAMTWGITRYLSMPTEHPILELLCVTCSLVLSSHHSPLPFSSSPFSPAWVLRLIASRPEELATPWMLLPGLGTQKLDLQLSPAQGSLIPRGKF